jgi:hypothetical protein
VFNLGVASDEQASTSNLMARDATEGSVSQQTLVVRGKGANALCEWSAILMLTGI